MRSASQERARLSELLAERSVALCSPLAANRAYMSDLEADIDSVRAAFVGAAVTEIAVLRASLFGRQEG